MEYDKGAQETRNTCSNTRRSSEENPERVLDPVIQEGSQSTPNAGTTRRSGLYAHLGTYPNKETDEEALN